MTRFFLTAIAIYRFFAALIVAIVSFYFASNVDLSYLLVICIPLTLWLIATGVGLLKKRNWARISIFILSGMAIVLGIIL